ncbi:minor capsid protein [Capybara microvirus Cap1_SP_188]|nr:minor capsid protein [Capybara microvirus Cap1_SP_188]
MAKTEKWRTKYDVLDISSVTGDGFNDAYEYTVEYSGHKKLVKKKVRDHIFNEIQCYKDSGNIELLVSRMQMDPNSLNVKSGFYGDLSNVPDNLIGFLNTQVSSENIWKKVPVEVKEAFDNDFNQFFVAMNSPEDFENRIACAFDKKNKIRYNNKWFTEDELKAYFDSKRNEVKVDD